MISGAALAVAAGCCIPVIILLFGLIITEFTSYAIAFGMVSNTSNASNTSNYFCNTSNDQILTNYIESSDINQLLQHRVLINASYIFGVAVTFFLSSLFSNLLWKLSGTNQAKSARIAFHKAVLEQDIAWFDINSPTLLLSRLTE